MRPNSTLQEEHSIMVLGLQRRERIITQPSGERPIIEMRSVVKTYDTGDIRVNALRGVSLTVPRGEMLAIMGPSGCGKTTLLNCMSGLDTIDDGVILIDGTDINKLNDNAKTTYRARNMGFVFQFYNLLPVLSAVGKGQRPPLLSPPPR